VCAATYDLSVDRAMIDTGDFRRQGIGYNGISPPPCCASRRAEVTINVTIFQ
jgi:hypothetical protein